MLLVAQCPCAKNCPCARSKLTSLVPFPGFKVLVVFHDLQVHTEVLGAKTFCHNIRGPEFGRGEEESLSRPDEEACHNETAE